MKAGLNIDTASTSELRDALRSAGVDQWAESNGGTQITEELDDIAKIREYAGTEEGWENYFDYIQNGGRTLNDWRAPGAAINACTDLKALEAFKPFVGGPATYSYDAAHYSLTTGKESDGKRFGARDSIWGLETEKMFDEAENPHVSANAAEEIFNDYFTGERLSSRVDDAGDAIVIIMAEVFVSKGIPEFQAIEYSTALLDRLHPNRLNT